MYVYVYKYVYIHIYICIWQFLFCSLVHITTGLSNLFGWPGQPADSGGWPTRPGEAAGPAS